MELKILNINDLCTGCGACVNICPRNCLELKPNDEGFYYPQYDSRNCIECHLCEKACHILSSDEKKPISSENFYMYASEDAEIRRNSSSGGCFSLIADYIDKVGGVIFGSKYNGEDERLEVFDSNQYRWEGFRKSKYIESYTANAFVRVAQYLSDSKVVFYCGTPCQIRGLYQFLKVKKIPIDNLFTADFICHGVPSNKCFTEYKRQFERGNKKVVNVDFRHKDFTKKKRAWHNMVLRMDFSNNTSKVIPYKEPMYYGYYKVFMDNIILRRGCYNCYYPSVSCADFTFADFWGIYKYKPEIDDNTGISVVKLHTQKSIDLWNKLDVNSEKLSYSVVKYLYDKPDKRLLLSSRDAFFKDMKQFGYMKATRKLYKKQLNKYYTIGWMTNLIKKLLKK